MPLGNLHIGREHRLRLVLRQNTLSFFPRVIQDSAFVLFARHLFLKKDFLQIVSETIAPFQLHRPAGFWWLFSDRRQKILFRLQEPSSHPYPSILYCPPCRPEHPVACAVNLPPRRLA